MPLDGLENGGLDFTRVNAWDIGTKNVVRDAKDNDGDMVFDPSIDDVRLTPADDRTNKGYNPHKHETLPDGVKHRGPKEPAARPKGIPNDPYDWFEDFWVM